MTGEFAVAFLSVIPVGNLLLLLLLTLFVFRRHPEAELKDPRIRGETNAGI